MDDEDAAAYRTDPRFKLYCEEVAVVLAQFDRTREWADLIRALQSLRKKLDKYPKYPVVPDKHVLAKRLAQCLNSHLPPGVHQKTLGMYAYVLQRIGRDRLARDLALYTVGLFPLYANASIQTKPYILELYEKFLLPLRRDLIPCLSALVMSLLPGLEEPSGEFYQRVLALMDAIAAATDVQLFWRAVWKALLLSPPLRISALNLLLARLPKPVPEPLYDTYFPERHTLVLQALILSLQDSNVLTQRYVLELLVKHFPLQDRLFTPDGVIVLVRAGVLAYLRREMALSRRLTSWLLGSQQDSPFFTTDVLPALKQALSDNFTVQPRDVSGATKPCKLLMCVLEKPEFGPRVVADVLPAVIRYLVTQGTGHSFSPEVVKTGQHLLDYLEPALIWRHLEHELDSAVDAAAASAAAAAATTASTDSAVSGAVPDAELTMVRRMLDILPLSSATVQIVQLPSLLLCCLRACRRAIDAHPVTMVADLVVALLQLALDVLARVSVDAASVTDQATLQRLTTAMNDVASTWKALVRCVLAHACSLGGGGIRRQRRAAINGDSALVSEIEAVATAASVSTRDISLALAEAASAGSDGKIDEVVGETDGDADAELETALHMMEVILSNTITVLSHTAHRRIVAAPVPQAPAATAAAAAAETGAQTSGLPATPQAAAASPATAAAPTPPATGSASPFYLQRAASMTSAELLGPRFEPWLEDLVATCESDDASVACLAIRALLDLLRQDWVHGMTPNARDELLGSDDASRIAARLWDLLAPRTPASHHVAVDLVVRLHSVHGECVTSVMRDALTHPQASRRAQGCQRFALLWTISGQTAQHWSPFPEVLLLMLDALHDDDPMIRVLASTWLTQAMNQLPRILNPLLDILLHPTTRRSNGVYVSQYDTRRVLYAIDSISTLVTSQPEEFAAQTCACYPSSALRERFQSLSGTATAGAAAVAAAAVPGTVSSNGSPLLRDYADLLMQTVLRFLLTDVPYFTPPDFATHNVLVQVRAAQFLMQLLDLMQQLPLRGCQLTLALQADVLRRLYTSVRDRDYVLQPVLLQLLRTILRVSDANRNARTSPKAAGTDSGGGGDTSGAVSPSASAGGATPRTSATEGGARSPRSNGVGGGVGLAGPNSVRGSSTRSIGATSAAASTSEVGAASSGEDAISRAGLAQPHLWSIVYAPLFAKTLLAGLQQHTTPTSSSSNGSEPPVPLTALRQQQQQQAHAASPVGAKPRHRRRDERAAVVEGAGDVVLAHWLRFIPQALPYLYGQLPDVVTNVSACVCDYVRDICSPVLTRFDPSVSRQLQVHLAALHGVVMYSYQVVQDMSSGGAFVLLDGAPSSRELTAQMRSAAAAAAGDGSSVSERTSRPSSSALSFGAPVRMLADFVKDVFTSESHANEALHPRDQARAAIHQLLPSILHAVHMVWGEPGAGRARVSGDTLRMADQMHHKSQLRTHVLTMLNPLLEVYPLHFLEALLRLWERSLRAPTDPDLTMLRPVFLDILNALDCALPDLILGAASELVAMLAARSKKQRLASILDSSLPPLRDTAVLHFVHEYLASCVLTERLVHAWPAVQSIIKDCLSFKSVASVPPLLGVLDVFVRRSPPLVGDKRLRQAVQAATVSLIDASAAIISGSTPLPRSYRRTASGNSGERPLSPLSSSLDSPVPLPLPGSGRTPLSSKATRGNDVGSSGSSRLRRRASDDGRAALVAAAAANATAAAAASAADLDAPGSSSVSPTSGHGAAGAAAAPAAPRPSSTDAGDEVAAAAATTAATPQRANVQASGEAVAAMYPSSEEALRALFAIRLLNVFARRSGSLLDTVFSDERERAAAALSSVLAATMPQLRGNDTLQMPLKRAAAGLLAALCDFPHLLKSVRKDISDVFLSPEFLQQDVATLRRWMKVVDLLMTSDRNSFAEIIGKGLSQQSNLLFVGREHESVVRARILRRLAFVVFAGEFDQYVAWLPAIQPKIVETLKQGVPHAVCAVLFALRVMLVKLNPANLTSFWPIILTELEAIFRNARDTDPELLLAAAKFLDYALVLSPADFRFFQWMFVQDSLDDSSGQAVEMAAQAQYQPAMDLLAAATRGNGATVTAASRTSLRRPLLHMQRIASVMDLRAFFHQISVYSYRSALSASPPDYAFITRELERDFVELDSCDASVADPIVAVDVGDVLDVDMFFDSADQHSSNATLDCAVPREASASIAAVAGVASSASGAVAVAGTGSRRSSDVIVKTIASPAPSRGNSFRSSS